MKYRINLAQKKRTNIFEQITYFFSHYLRYILVITQLVVIGVLFYRFRIDQNIIDLKEKIDDKKVIVKETTPFIIEAQKIEKKTGSITSVIEKNKRLSSMIAYSFSKFPRDANLLRIEVTDDSVTMQGNALDARQLQQYYGLLRKEGRFASVNLTDLIKSTDGFSFTLILSHFKS